MKTIICLKRAYEPQQPDDGFRIYVDHLWPRGLSHETFHYDLWDKAIAPSTELREWFHANPTAEWEEFARRYDAELTANPAYASLRALVATKPKVTLLYSSRDTLHNNALILRTKLLNSPVTPQT